ncbi:hypothetical protein FRC06_000876 [Ceratobasidium sp. 370]|nr:hypothetical protein FRC06_000876 [Ceratobasidium sp. 370]
MAGRDNFSASDLSKDSNEERFLDWSEAVRLRSERLVADALPRELEEVVKLSETLPTWFRNNADSPPYSSLDPELRQPGKLLSRKGPPNDSTILLADDEIRTTWVTTTRGSRLQELEPTLNLPKAGSSGVRCSSVTPDSAFFITAGDALLRRPPELLRDFSSLAEQERFKTLFVPHLLTGYKSPATAGIPALRQLKIAMVSALYQRHALRHPEHFVFGICHTRISSVSVVAATWVPRNPPNGEEGPQDAGEKGDYAHASTSKATLEASRQSDELEVTLRPSLTPSPF